MKVLSQIKILTSGWIFGEVLCYKELYKKGLQRFHELCVPHYRL